MDRLEYLQRSIHTWFKFADEIIIIDWSSKKPITLKNVLSRYKNNNFKINSNTPIDIKIFRIEDQNYYNMAISRNVSVLLSSYNNLFILDSDIILHQYNLNIQKLVSSLNVPFISDRTNLSDRINNSGLYYRGYLYKEWEGTTGTVLIRKELFNLIGGYNEDIDGYFSMDTNFYYRLKNINKILKNHRNLSFNIEERFFPKNILFHIKHSNKLRFKNIDFSSLLGDDGKIRRTKKLNNFFNLGLNNNFKYSKFIINNKIGGYEYEQISSNSWIKIN